MDNPIIKRYGDHWERDKIFSVKSGKVEWTELGWPENDPPLKGAKGLLEPRPPSRFFQIPAEAVMQAGRVYGGRA